MNARSLLETIEARGGVATVKRGQNGAAVLNVAPRSCCTNAAKPAKTSLLGVDRARASWGMEST